MNSRIVFMGSPDFAVPTLSALADSFQVVGVITQPDRPAGRGRTVTAPPVKKLALELGLPLIQPHRLKQPEAMQILRDWDPQLIIVAAYGQILREDVLNLPVFGCVNVHASLLPRWRGAAPIQAAIRHGDKKTGITIMKMDQGIDTGPIISQRQLDILPDDTAGTLSKRLAVLGAKFLAETLPLYTDGEITPLAQNEAEATYAPILKKADGLLDFNSPAAKLVNQVRAFNPWPGAFAIWKEQRLKVHRASVCPCSDPFGEPVKAGNRIIYKGLPAVVTSNGVLLLDEVQPAGKKTMMGEVFLRGARDWD